jgi:hypothetical protein
MSKDRNWLKLLLCDAPLNSSKDSNANPKVKTMEKGIGVCSLARSTLAVKRVCWNSRMGTKMNSQDEMNLHN